MTERDVADLSLPLERDPFLRRLLRELAGTLEDVVGLDEAAGYVSVVGSSMGRSIDRDYRRALQVDRLNRSQVAAVLADLKRRIEGEFHVVEESDDRLVLEATRCPFGAYVEGRPSLCMMTSNVFGRIAADNLGYAAVDIEQAIARGDAGCRVVVKLRPGEAGADAREYHGHDSDSG